MTPPRKLHIKSYGCQMNVYDAQRMVDTLAPEGFVETASVDDADLEVLDEQDDVGSGVGSAEADVVESAGVAQGEAAGFVDAVVSDPVVGVGAAGGSG